MKKIVAVVIALALLCVGVTAFAAPKKSPSPEDSALLTQIAEAKATLRQGKSEINAMRTANYRLAAEIRNTISANGIKAIPSLKSKLLEIKGLLKLEKYAVKAQKPVTRAINNILTQAKKAKLSQNALDLYNQAIAKQNGLAGMVKDSNTRLNEILTKAKEYAALAAAEREKWGQFKTQAESKLATVEANHEQITALNQEIKIIFQRMSAKLEQALAAPPVPDTLTAFLPEFTAGVSTLKQQLGTMYEGQVKAKMDEYRAHKKAGEYDAALADLDAVIQIQQSRLADLPGIKDAALELEKKLDTAISGGSTI